ncbi:MAG: hypothetical protein V7675_08530 [Hyphomonas sp.]|uniref:hypothetical protein n=1 Tax=Hyphomonas sp. TaxID=87 RepID=UPI003002F631
MAGFRTPFHLGGPLGLAGLATLAGATGLFVLAGSPEDRDEPAVPLSGLSEGASGSQVDTRVDRDESPLVGVLPDETAPVAPAEEPFIQPEAAPPAVITAEARGAEVTFIVRIKGAPEIDSVARLYKKDPAAAEQAFSDYVRRTPQLENFSLVGASYSGEIKLAYQMPPGTEPTRAAISDVQKKIMAVDGVAYADPDYVAHPGEKN